MMGGNNYELEFHKDAQVEYNKLNKSQLVVVDKGLARIAQRGMLAGEKLHGKLHMCRKIKHKQAGLRIVFTQKDKSIQIIQILAVSKRSDSKVYEDTEGRM